MRCRPGESRCGRLLSLLLLSSDSNHDTPGLRSMSCGCMSFPSELAPTLVACKSSARRTIKEDCNIKRIDVAHVLSTCVPSTRERLAIHIRIVPKLGNDLHGVWNIVLGNCACPKMNEGYTTVLIVSPPNAIRLGSIFEGDGGNMSGTGESGT